MSTPADRYLETLKRKFEENRDRVWTDASIPFVQKQPEVERLWREYDARRREVRDGPFDAAPADRAVPPGPAGRPMPFLRKRRRPWK